MEDASTAGGKLSFGFTAVAKPKKAVVVHAEERKETRQLITGLEGSRIQTAEPEQNNAKTYVVPKLENTFKTGKKTFTPSFVPPTSDTKVGATDEKFEPAAQPDQPSITTYGLDIRQRQAMDAGDQAAASQPIDFRDLELQKLKEDMEQLPDEASLEVNHTSVASCIMHNAIHDVLHCRPIMLRLQLSHAHFSSLSSHAYSSHQMLHMMQHPVCLCLCLCPCPAIPSPACLPTPHRRMRRCLLSSLGWHCCVAWAGRMVKGLASHDNWWKLSSQCADLRG